jgi:hypothetical protein
MSNAGCASTRPETLGTRPIRCGISTTRGRNFASVQDRSPTKYNRCAGSAYPHCGLALAIEGISDHMLRIPVLAIVLALGIGPNAALLCRAWCTGDNLPQACHQQTASATVDARNCCDGGEINLSKVRSGEARQDKVSPNQEAGAAQHHVVVSVASVHLSHRHEPRGSNENCLVTVLRI